MSHSEIFFGALIKAAGKPLPKPSTLNQWANDSRTSRWTAYKPPEMKMGADGIRKATQTTGFFAKLKGLGKPKIK